MSAAKKLFLIAIGYALSIVGGLAVVVVHELLTAADIAQNSCGMAAFGDMILVILAAGFFGLAPTWVLLRLAVEKAPSALLAAQIVIAALGPASWLAAIHLTGIDVAASPWASGELLGVLLTFAMLRIMVGPVLLVIEGATFILAQTRSRRALLASAMLMEFVPLGLFTLHVAAATHL